MQCYAVDGFQHCLIVFLNKMAQNGEAGRFAVLMCNSSGTNPVCWSTWSWNDLMRCYASSRYGAWTDVACDAKRLNCCTCAGSSGLMGYICQLIVLLIHAFLCRINSCINVKKKIIIILTMINFVFICLPVYRAIKSLLQNYMCVGVVLLTLLYVLILIIYVYTKNVLSLFVSVSNRIINKVNKNNEQQ